MKKLIVLRVLAVVMVMLASLVTARPAAASAPIQTKTSLDWIETAPAGTICSFTVYFHHTWPVSTSKFYDNGGNWIRTQEIYQGFKDVMYKDVNGHKVTGQGSGMVVTEPVSPTVNQVTINGHEYSVTVPGYGVYFGSIGQHVYTVSATSQVDIKLVGNQAGWDFGGLWDVICPYIAS
jgi:hypothetical protein